MHISLVQSAFVAVPVDSRVLRRRLCPKAALLLGKRRQKPRSARINLYLSDAFRNVYAVRGGSLPHTDCENSMVAFLPRPEQLARKVAHGFFVTLPLVAKAAVQAVVQG